MFAIIYHNAFLAGNQLSTFQKFKYNSCSVLYLQFSQVKNFFPPEQVVFLKYYWRKGQVFVEPQDGVTNTNLNLGNTRIRPA